MTWRLRAVLSMAVVGVLIAAYLTALHYAAGGVRLVCVGQGHGIINCESVLTSPESVVMGIPVPVWGLFWFLAVIFLAWFGRHRQGLSRFLLAWSLAGGVVVVYLVYVEFDVLHALCVWCSALHLLILAILSVEVYEAGLRT